MAPTFDPSNSTPALSRVTGGNQDIKRRGCFFIPSNHTMEVRSSLPFLIDDKDKFSISEYPRLSGVKKVVTASGNNRKIEALERMYQPEIPKVEGKCPEELSGVKESAGIDAVRIAKEKGDVVETYLVSAEDEDEMIEAADVVVAVWAPNSEHDQAFYLNKLDRFLDTKSNESTDRILSEAKAKAVLMYSSGVFYAVWHIGKNYRRLSQGWEEKAGVRIKAEFDPIPKEIVEERFNDPEAVFSDNTLINLISLVGTHARRVTIRNKSETSEKEVELNPFDPILEQLVRGCVLPHAILSQVLAVETPVSPTDGTRLINFSQFDIIRRNRE